MSANALTRHPLCSNSGHSHIGAYLGLAIAILPVAASAKSCQQKYIVIDQTNVSITHFFYEQNGRWSNNLLATVIYSGGQQMVMISGRGESEFKAVFSGGRVVSGQTPDICARSQIVIYREDDFTPRMVVR